MSPLVLEKKKVPVDVTSIGSGEATVWPPRLSGHMYEFYYQVESYLKLTVGPPQGAGSLLTVDEKFQIPFTVTNTAPTPPMPWRVSLPVVRFKNIVLRVSGTQFAALDGDSVFGMPDLRAGQSATVLVPMKAIAAHADVGQAGELLASAQVRAKFDFDAFSDVRSNREVAFGDIYPD